MQPRLIGQPWLLHSLWGLEGYFRLPDAANLPSCTKSVSSMELYCLWESESCMHNLTTAFPLLHYSSPVGPQRILHPKLQPGNPWKRETAGREKTRTLLHLHPSHFLFQSGNFESSSIYSQPLPEVPKWIGENLTESCKHPQFFQTMRAAIHSFGRSLWIATGCFSVCQRDWSKSSEPWDRLHIIWLTQTLNGVSRQAAAGLMLVVFTIQKSS